MTFKELLQQSGMNIKQMSDYFKIPYRTAQDWNAGRRTPPEYLLGLMAYKLEKEKKQP